MEVNDMLVKEIIVNQLNVAVDVINDEREIVKDLGADSLDIVEILMNLEEERLRMAKT